MIGLPRFACTQTHAFIVRSVARRWCACPLRSCTRHQTTCMYIYIPYICIYVCMYSVVYKHARSDDVRGKIARRSKESSPKRSIDTTAVLLCTARESMIFYPSIASVLSDSDGNTYLCLYLHQVVALRNADHAAAAGCCCWGPAECRVRYTFFFPHRCGGPICGPCLLSFRARATLSGVTKANGKKKHHADPVLSPSSL